MSNPEHVALLKKSVGEWNQWREQNSEAIPNLRGANLFEANLRGANLEDANLQGTNLRGASLQGTNLRGASLQGGSLLMATNLTCEQINSVFMLDSNTLFQDYLEVKITGEKKWTCKEVKKEMDPLDLGDNSIFINSGSSPTQPTD